MPATPADVAELAYAEVMASKPRTPERRAAVCLYISASVPPAKSLQAVRNAIGTFGADTVQADALELLDRLTAQLVHEGPAVQGGHQRPPGSPVAGGAVTEQERTA